MVRINFVVIRFAREWREINDVGLLKLCAGTGQHPMFLSEAREKNVYL